MPRAEATGRTQGDAVADMERSWRNLADALQNELAALKRTHPETITVSIYTRLRRNYLERLAADIDAANAMTEFLASLRRQLDDRHSGRRD